ncbi:MAG TPA: alpha/beta fold hydrolase [Gaiellaceae bacterium]|nr:alpha/beta fold hydrolase [Gaiellaceae bacterium]
MTATREDVEYRSDGDTIAGWFHPAAGSGPAPAIVFCPGFTGTRQAAFYQPYVERFVDAGYGVLLADYRGWGDSGGPRGEIVPLRQVADVRNALGYLETRDDVDPARLAVVGVSFGGGNALYTAAVDERVRAVVSVSAVTDGRAWMRSMRREYEWHELLDRLAEDRRARTRGEEGAVVDPTEEILVSTPERRTTTVKGNVPAALTPKRTPLWCAQEVIDFRPVEKAAQISPRAALLFYVARDAVVPGEQSEWAYAAAGEPKKLVRLDGDKHYEAYLEHFDRIAGETLAWLSAHC